jgi:protein ImuA
MPTPSDATSAGSKAAASKAAVLAELRGRIRRMEGIGGADGTRFLPLGVPDVDGVLPEGGLPLGCLHEVVGENDPFNSVATGFSAAILARISSRRTDSGHGGSGSGQVVWITRDDDLYAPGIAAYGLKPERLIVVSARRDSDILWAMEESLRCRSLAAVLGEIGDIDMVASRRLQLAAEASGVTALLLRSSSRRLGTTASVTRWGLSAAPSLPVGGLPGYGRAEGGGQGVGLPRWRTRLLRCRGGQPGEWLLEWRGDGFALADDPPEGAFGETEPEWLQRMSSSVW